MRLGAGAAALGLFPNPCLASNPSGVNPGDPEAEETLTTSGTSAEMAIAKAWAQAFHMPAVAYGKTAASIFPEATQPPFSFIYAGRPSAELLPGWKFAIGDTEIDATKQQQEFTYSDPKSGLVLHCVATIFKDFPAVEWVIYFKNTGSADTPILEDIQALDARLVVFRRRSHDSLRHRRDLLDQ